MKTRRSTKAGRDSAATATNLMLAPMVMMMRMPLMAFEARGANSLGVESMRAVSEKAEAMAAGAFAAQASMMQAAARFWPELMSGRTPSILNGVAMEHSMNAALKPAGRTVKANFKRLSKS